jgi:hypothetical protein
VPAAGADVSFVVTAAHVQRYRRHALVSFLSSFVQDFHVELSGAKIALRRRCRAAAGDFWGMAAALAPPRA